MKSKKNIEPINIGKSDKPHTIEDALDWYVEVNDGSEDGDGDGDEVFFGKVINISEGQKGKVRIAFIGEDNLIDTDDFEDIDWKSPNVTWRYKGSPRPQSARGKFKKDSVEMGDNVISTKCKGNLRTESVIKCTRPATIQDAVGWHVTLEGGKISGVVMDIKLNENLLLVRFTDDDGNEEETLTELPYRGARLIWNGKANQLMPALKESVGWRVAIEDSGGKMSGIVTGYKEKEKTIIVKFSSVITGSSDEYIEIPYKSKLKWLPKD